MSIFGQGNPKEDYHFTTAERREELKGIAYETGDLKAFGEYLHALQDSYSHQKDGVPYESTFGHFDIGTEWFTNIELYNGVIPISRGLLDSALGNYGEYLDKTYNRPEIADDMAKTTYQEIQKFLSSRNNITPMNRWSDISYKVKQFNRAFIDDSSKKGAILLNK